MENNIESMLEEESLNFIEPDFSSLINHGEPGVIITEAKKDITASKILIDENENPLIFAVRCGDVWSASSWLYREPTREEIGIFDDVSGDLYQEKRIDIEKALRDYFSRRLINEVSPASEDLTDSRADIVRDLFEELLGKNISGSCIDACCGSGVGSMILRDMGGYVYAYDNDPALLSSGFASGRLNLEDTVCIDGRTASAYLPDADIGVGIMFGQMYEYTKDIWCPIVEEFAGITDKTLITVATKQEAEWVKSWAENVGKSFDIFENERDPIYDRWVCFG